MINDNDKVATPAVVDTRPKPSKQQRKFFLGLIDRLMKLMDEESEYFWMERPFLEDPNAERKIIEKPEWENEKRVLHKKILKVHEELDKLQEQMYPPSIYPEMYGAKEQPALIEGIPSQMHNLPKDPPKTVENMSLKEIEAAFDKKKPDEIIATTTAGSEILKRFEERKNRTRGY